MKEGSKQFLIRGIIFILLLLLVFPYIRHFFVHSIDQMNAVYYTERISLIVGIAFIILFFMLKEKLPEVKAFQWKNLLFAILALALFFSTFMLEADFDTYMQMGLVHAHGNHADIGGGWILGESIGLQDDINILITPIEKQIILDNTSNVKIRWYGVWYSWSKDKNFSVTMLVNNNSYDITPEHKKLKEGEKGWMEIYIPEEQLVKGVNDIVMKADGNQSGVMVIAEYTYIDSKTKSSASRINPILLYATSPCSKTFKTLLNLKFLIKILAIVCLFLAVFGTAAAKSLVSRKESALALIFSYIVYFFSFGIQPYWRLFSSAATSISYFLLKIISKDAAMAVVQGNPLVGITPFIVQINAQCSGTEGLAFFTIMSALIVMIDWNKTDKKKLWIIPAGLVGMFLVNCIRITSIILIGKYISEDFAVNTFHTNVGWVLFILYFIVFWYFAYRWLVGKKK
jgi:exosortase/archaeosortase family protein